MDTTDAQCRYQGQAITATPSQPIQVLSNSPIIVCSKEASATAVVTLYTNAGDLGPFAVEGTDLTPGAREDLQRQITQVSTILTDLRRGVREQYEEVNAVLVDLRSSASRIQTDLGTQTRGLQTQIDGLRNGLNNIGAAVEPIPTIENFLNRLFGTWRVCAAGVEFSCPAALVAPDPNAGAG